MVSEAQAADIPLYYRLSIRPGSNSILKTVTNHLYYGDNLQVLRECIATESVDLVHLDPPSNSQATYTVLC